MAAKSEQGERKSSSGKKKSGGGGGSSSGGGSGAANMLRSVVGSAGGADGIIEIIERLGLMDVVLGRVKSRIEEVDLDEILDDATDYLRRNPEVLVVTLGAVTVATGLLVWLNNRREWDGTERRNAAAATATSSSAKARRTTAAARAAELDDDDDD
ncbi:MAG TPA: hypothetical protein VGF28_12890 [Thermoanaerobaculia bacterium]|jgi:hypothetical protein